MLKKSFFYIGAFFLAQTTNAQVLKSESFQHYVDHFNTMEDENNVTDIPNSQSWQWMQQNVPLFECPDKKMEEIYYFRWWSLRKHIEKTQQGNVITEFIIRRSYADKYNLISSALGHHVYEARWLRDTSYLNNNLRVWLRGNNGQPMKKLNAYSSWLIDAMYNRYLVNSDVDAMKNYYPDLVADYKDWEAQKRYPQGLFWQFDVKDAMEETISGGRREKNPRPSINGYMYGNAVALSKIAAINNDNASAQLYQSKADSIKRDVQEKLWNSNDQFFEVRKEPADTLANVREEIGFIPWYFNMPDKQYNSAWKTLMDPEHFNAPSGITTADRSHARFRMNGCCKCEWDGAVWPFASSQTLTAMANFINNYHQKVVDKADYFAQLSKFAYSQYADGKPYIGEYMDEKTGKWLTADARGRYYNHSTFNDLVITGLVGLRPRADNIIEVNPLVPAKKWDWFCLDDVLYHGKNVTIVWDKTGKKYNKGKGLSVWADGKLVAHSKSLKEVSGSL